MNNVRRRCESLLAQAKKVFGSDLVVDAYVMTWEVPGVSTEDEVKARLDDLENQSWGIGDELRFDSETIAIVFSNGVTVEFFGSEWESMGRPDGPRREA